VAFTVGQRWVSETEPELGLGIVEHYDARTVTIQFPASNERRQYALEQPPLCRVRFQAGDQFQMRDGTRGIVEKVWEQAGLTWYSSNGRQIPENELDDHISFSAPEERLRHGHADPTSAFDLRLAALQHQYRRRKSTLRGFVGGRIELIPHQLYVATEATHRLAPRILLADEVGLGKTIEACLILHRWLQTGLAHRVLVLVPDALVHQWFVELLRRFHLWFHIFNEERCDTIETANPDTNPFLDDQLVLCSIKFLAANPRRAEQIVPAGWDVVVVDEAHHLSWTPQAVSPEYTLVEALAARTPALLLLTGTPEQLGLTSHFARLRLLDPDRYSSLEAFLLETERFQRVATVAGKLINRQKPVADEVQILADLLGTTVNKLQAKLEVAEPVESPERAQLIDALIDRHGTGRVMFRNTRSVLGGFPKRRVGMQPLPAGPDSERLFVELADEFAADTRDQQGAVDYSRLLTDPRLAWLAALLRRVAPEKVLLICRSQKKVLAIHQALRRLVNVKAAIFHEALPLVQRDRNAAWFAEEDGAQVLLASEIGSEGRNFQFAHHLVLYDLPPDPDLLEQRIGRLDRIGQSAEIHIHVPFVESSPHEVLARWFHEGLNGFEQNLRGGRQLFERFGERVHDLAQDFHETHEQVRPELASLIDETRAAAATAAHRLEQGRDRLLELNSYRPAVAGQTVQAIAALDQDRALEEFLLTVFDHFHIPVEELAPRTYFLGSAGVFADSFPRAPARRASCHLRPPTRSGPRRLPIPDLGSPARHGCVGFDPWLALRERQHFDVGATIRPGLLFGSGFPVGNGGSARACTWTVSCRLPPSASRSIIAI
jgi:ATP-dependent helicase HepA